jgi:phage terminase small subunit
VPSAKPKGSDPTKRRGRPAKPKVAKGRALAAPLTIQQRLFVSRYLVHFNATRAYREAYPEASLATADTEGPRLTKDPRISSEIARGERALRSRYKRSAEKTLDEIALVAFGNVADLLDENGDLKAFKDLPRHVSAMVASFERAELKATDPSTGETRVIGHTHKVRMHSKLDALKLLATNEGSLVAKVEVGGAGDFDERLRQSRERAEKAIRDRHGKTYAGTAERIDP